MTEILFKELSSAVMGAAIEVHKTLPPRVCNCHPHQLWNEFFGISPRGQIGKQKFALTPALAQVPGSVRVIRAK